VLRITTPSFDHNPPHHTLIAGEHFARMQGLLLEATMDTRAMPALAFAGLMTVAIAVAVQTAPSREADICVLPQTVAEEGHVELAAMFTNDTQRADRTLFSDAPLFIYAMNDVARASDGVTLVDVSDVTSSCARHKNII
jgi:hypothetical protein